MAEPRRWAPCVFVIAGVNGAGRSSIAGAALRLRGADYFDPDAASRKMRSANPQLTLPEANSAAWHQGKRLLERAIIERRDLAFETTLGGRTMAGLLERALDAGLEVKVWYAGLASPELHVERVRARVAAGGHPIPESDIRRRYDASRANLVGLLPKLTELRLYDNSIDVPLQDGARPELQLVLHLKRGAIVGPARLDRTPEWAKPIVAAALRLPRSRSSSP